jgi:mannose-6-phosphate isomerase-like protein (cupin superfamily)
MCQCRYQRILDNMKKPVIKSEGKNYSAIDIGNLDDLMNHSYMHPKMKKEVKGKVFVGEILKSTGVEISFQVLPPHTDIPFLHNHIKHEEIYIFMKGTGEFQVDDNLFDINEGTIVKISPQGKRTWRNSSDEPMIFMVIQSMVDSLDNYFVSDGQLSNGKILWEK